MAGCDKCDELLQEILVLERKGDERYEEFRRCSVDFEKNKVKDTMLLQAIHTRMDRQDEQRTELANVVKYHMDAEEEHHTMLSDHMAKTNQILLTVPNKVDLAKTNGRVTTMWIVGSLVGTFLIAIILLQLWYIKLDVQTHMDNASKASQTTAQPATPSPSP